MNKQRGKEAKGKEYQGKGEEERRRKNGRYGRVLWFQITSPVIFQNYQVVLL